jgi:hypothetical protein
VDIGTSGSFGWSSWNPSLLTSNGLSKGAHIFVYAVKTFGSALGVPGDDCTPVDCLVERLTGLDTMHVGTVRQLESFMQDKYYNMDELEENPKNMGIGAGELKEVGWTFGRDVNGLGLIVMVDVNDQSVCCSIIIGGVRACMLEQHACAAQSHVKPKAALEMGIIYVLAGEGHCRKPMAPLGWSVPTQLLSDRLVEPVGISLTHNDFQFFGNSLGGSNP